MTEVEMSSQLAGSGKLWRYMSLDKLIDLLSTKELFFAPLSSFMKTDPYEGLLPAAAIDAFAEIFRAKSRDVESLWLEIQGRCKREGRQLSGVQRRPVARNLEDLKAAPRLFFKAIAQCQTVNCWHANDSESEAMWRLYSESGKAVAVETTVDALRQSIQSRGSGHRVHIYPVKYVDFFDNSLTPRDCSVEGNHLTPLLKRLSYQHEKEVRLFIGLAPGDPMQAADLRYWKPAPVRLPVDIKVLVRRVHVSPYSSDPFGTSVTRICELLGLPVSVVERSKLLSGEEELLKRLDC